MATLMRKPMSQSACEAGYLLRLLQRGDSRYIVGNSMVGTHRN